MCHDKLEINLFLNNNNISFMFELLDYPTKVKESINVLNVMLVMNCQNIAADHYSFCRILGKSCHEEKSF